MQFRKITIVGVGLLGGSLGLAIKRRRLAGEVVGYVRRVASIAECKKFKAVDSCTRNLSEAVHDADLIILCTPLARMRSLVEQMLPALKSGAIVTDVGSVKASVVHEIENPVARAGGFFVGSHPMAGAEKSGVSAARADLFDRAVCVVTPSNRSQPAAVRKVEQFWKAIGGRVLRLTPEIHDALVSRSSHLPHVAAVALANFVLDPEWPDEQSLLCATGFRDTTRIASGSTEMWRDIAISNRRNLSRSLKKFISALQQFDRLLARGDSVAITRLFNQAKSRRDAWCARSVIKTNADSGFD